MGLQVRNTGDVSFLLRNLTVTVFLRDPIVSRSVRVLATLRPSVPEITLGPGGSTGVLLVQQTEAPASLIKDLLSNPSGLSFQVATFNLLDDAGRDFAFLDEITNSRTALVTLDFGNGLVEHHRVATDVQRNPDGTAAGVSMRMVMQDILKIDYETRSGEIIAADGLISTEEVLYRIRDVQTQNDATPPEKKFWVVLGSDRRHVRSE